jgi:hypothetical protein
MKEEKKQRADLKNQDTRPEFEFESPQTEESRRLANSDTANPVERKDENPSDHGEKRGGNQSVNQE